VTGQVWHPRRTPKQLPAVLIASILEIDGIPERLGTASERCLQREIMVSASTQHPIEILLSEPLIYCRQVRAVVVEEVEHVSTVDQHVPIEFWKLTMSLMCIADDDNLHRF